VLSLIEKASELLTFAKTKKISDIVYENEKSMRSEEVIHSELMRIWNTIWECIHRLSYLWILPGGLNVRRRA
jgi:L-serine dehydratase